VLLVVVGVVVARQSSQVRVARGWSKVGGVEDDDLVPGRTLPKNHRS
jgi:hypothetical protein